MKKTILFLLLAIGLSTAHASEDDSLKSISGITNQMLNLISVEIGEEPDWQSYRKLFLPSAQKLALLRNKAGEERLMVLSLEDFIEKAGPNYAKGGFLEYAIGLEVHEFNGIANVFQSFYCKNLTGTYENRGMNAYQLVYKENRWWIAQVLYTNESEDSPLPEYLLFKK